MRSDFIPFGAPLIEEDEIAEVVDALRSGWIGTGPRVARFEEAFRSYAHAASAVAVSSCTAALHLALRTARVGEGDEVITTAMTYSATANAIVHAGARPVLVDCDPVTGLIDPAKVVAAITDRTRAIIPVHLYGRPCDLDSLAEIAGHNDLVLVEDAAHATESWYRGAKIGSVGDFTCFSFYVSKSLVTGEGGMVTAKDADREATLRSWRLNGLDEDAWSRFRSEDRRVAETVLPGFKCNMTDIQAALAMPQIPKLKGRLDRRSRIWEHYDEAFCELPVEIPEAAEPDTVHARHIYALRIEASRCGQTRDEFARRLHDRGIGSGVHFVGVHLQPYYRKTLGLSPEDLPRATELSGSLLSLPLSAALSDLEVSRVVDAVRGVAARGAESRFLAPGRRSSLV